MSDMTGHDATQRDDLHTMTLTELEVAVGAAGVLISRRQLMRHCEAGTFDAKRLPAVNNLEQWFVAPASVERGIADIKTLQEQRARRDASRPDMTGHDAPEIPNNGASDTSGHDASRPDTSDTKESHDTAAQGADTVRHDASRPPMSDHDGGPTEPVTPRYVEQLEKRIEEKDDVIGMLRGELAQRNEEIVRRNERERETNILIRGLQNLVLQLQPGQSSNKNGRRF